MENIQYMTIKQASEKWEICKRQLCTMCNQGRVKGAVKKSMWLIPLNADKPESLRNKKLIM